jgi:hypothetical protein
MPVTKILDIATTLPSVKWRRGRLRDAISAGARDAPLFVRLTHTERTPDHNDTRGTSVRNPMPDNELVSPLKPRRILGRAGDSVDVARGDEAMRALGLNPEDVSLDTRRRIGANPPSGREERRADRPACLAHRD